MPRRGAAAVLALAAALATGCGGDDKPEPKRAGAATGPAELQVDVAVRANIDDTWGKTAEVRPGDDFDIRLRVGNDGGRQASNLRGGLRLPEGVEYIRGTAARYQVPPPGTGAPIDGDQLTSAAFPLEPLPGGGDAEFQLAARLRSGAGGSQRISGRVSGEGGPESDAATVRVP